MAQARRASGSAAPKAPKRPIKTASDRQHMVAEAAYYRAEKRGFSGGHEMEDWLEAEHEIDQQMRKH